MSKGSIWRKWDLHIHTPESHEQQYQLSSQDQAKFKGNVWEKFIDTLEAQSDFAAIGITDYFSLEGYVKISEYRKKGRLANFDLILPNIEFRLDRVLATREGESSPRLNYHVIFSDEVDVSKIQTEFLQSIDIETEEAEKRTLTRENIEEIGRNLKEHHTQFQGRSDYYVGCTSIYVSLDQIIEILEEKSSIFGGKYILALADDYWSQIDWDQSHLIRRTLLMKSDALFASNPKTREWALGRSEDYKNPGQFIHEFGRLFPSVHGSDAHSFDELFLPDLERYCWIKADPTFEGLRQIVFEPEDRVRIQHENPEPRKSLYTLDEVDLRNTKISQEVALTEQSIPLNWNLVAVTGGKGSGKTALVDLIANLFENRTESGGKDENSFVQRIQDEKPDLHVEIGFLGEDVSAFAKKLMDDSFYERSEITYLPQGKINEMSGRRESMDSIIQEIIFDNKRVLKGSYKQKFEYLKSELKALAGVIDELNGDIYKAEQEVDPQVIADVQRSKLLKEGELEDRQDELDRFTEGMKEGTKINIEEVEAEEAELRRQHSILSSLLDDYDELKADVELEIDRLNAQVADMNLQSLEFSSIPQIVTLDKEPLITSIAASNAAATKLVKGVGKELEEKEKALEELSDEELRHAELLKAVRDLSAEIEGVSKQLKELEEKSKRVTRQEAQRLRGFRDLIEVHNRLKRFYRTVIGEFAKGKSEILEGIDFSSTIHFDSELFLQFGIDLLDNRMVKEDDVANLAVQLENAINESSKPNRAEAIDNYVDDLFGYRDKVRKARTGYDFFAWCFQDYFSLSTAVLFNGIQLSKLSMGQKGTVLLKLFLAEGDHPLVVDQPEESLDNKFIYAELVNAIRNAKRLRQVIIATNNANLVVNTDADQVIVAEFANNVIEYRSGTLEDKTIRDEIIPILEGGEEAFKRRENRYGF